MSTDVSTCIDTMQIVCFSNLESDVLVSVLASGKSFKYFYLVLSVHIGQPERLCHISYLLTFLSNGNSPYITQDLEHDLSFCSGCNSFTQQMTAPQLILK
jgi:hypothetical protein